MEKQDLNKIRRDLHKMKKESKNNFRKSYDYSSLGVDQKMSQKRQLNGHKFQNEFNARSIGSKHPKKLTEMPNTESIFHTQQSLE